MNLDQDIKNKIEMRGFTPAEREALKKKARESVAQLTVIDRELQASYRKRQKLGRGIIVAALTLMVAAFFASLPGCMESPVAPAKTVPWCMLLLCFGQGTLIRAYQAGIASAEAAATATRMITILEDLDRLEGKLDDEGQNEAVVEQ